MTELMRQYLASAKDGQSGRTRRMKFYESYAVTPATTYDHLQCPWDQSNEVTGQQIPFRSRRPSVLVPLAAMVVNVFVRALWGAGRRPTASIVDAAGTADNQILADILDEAGLVKTFSEATRRALRTGSGCVVWRVVEGKLESMAWDACHVRADFEPFPKLRRLEYVYRYEKEVIENGRVRCAYFWHKEVIGRSIRTEFNIVEVA